MIASIVIGLIIAVLIVLDVRYIVKKKSQGACIGCSASGCNGGCSKCNAAAVKKQ